jgi:aryl-alcohol dehydrogenase-like predicted oxidoreductase
MNYRNLGTSTLSVSEIGFGAWGIGGAMWKQSDDAESLAALRKAIDLGLNFIDTALAYGNGHSEGLVGRVVREQKKEIVVATKIPPKNMEWPARKGVPFRDVFPASHIISCTEQSLRNLQVERIDIQQLHVWQDDWAGVDEIWSAVEKLKKEGKIRLFGISINDHDPGSALLAAKTGRVDTFQVIYNIFDQSPEEELFPCCAEAGIGIIVRVPFDEGGLTGTITPQTKFPWRDWRNDYFRGDRKREVYDRVEKLKPLLGPEAATLPELALRFCLAHPAVSTVIPGMRKIGNVESNCRVSDGKSLSDSLLSELKQHVWRRNFYGA